jgi:hypothetical protein
MILKIILVKKGRGSREWGEYVDRPAAYVGDDAMVEMVPPERDIHVNKWNAG